MPYMSLGSQPPISFLPEPFPGTAPGPAPQDVVTSVTQTAPTGMYSPAQLAIVKRILSGQEDYTFGPGSPNPTAEDRETYVGGKFSPAAGFAVNRGVALAPAEYHLFTPEQRRALGIMDIAPADQVGKIERYYAMGGYGGPAASSGSASDVPPMEDTLHGQYASFNTNEPTTGPSAFGSAVGGFGKSLMSMGGRGMAQSQTPIPGFHQSPFGSIAPMNVDMSALMNLINSFLRT